PASRERDEADSKIDGEWQAAAPGRASAEPGRVGEVRGLGVEPGWDWLCGRGGRSGGEGGRLARELLELADQVVFLAVPAAAGLIEVGTQIAVAGVGVGQQVPHDGQDRVADRDKGALLATALAMRR